MEILAFALPAHPSEIDFRNWLATRTPDGAPTLVISAPGGRGPLRLPQLRAPVLSPARRRGRKRRGMATAVQAACLVDIDGLTPRQVAASGLCSSERSARQHVREGRFVASELGLWPWAAVGGQALPRAWWLDERFALAIERWATELRPPEVEPAVRRLHLRVPIA